MAYDIERQIRDISIALERISDGMYITVARNRELKRKAAASTEAAMYLLAPVGETGNLRRSIQFLPFKRSFDVFVGPNYKIGPHAHLVNNGFIHYKSGKPVHSRGEYFIERAYARTRYTVLQQLTKLAQKEFEKIGRKLEVSE